MSRLIASEVFDLVAEGHAARLSQSQIALTYGLSLSTVHMYLWALRHPAKYRVWREREAAKHRLRRATDRAQRSPLVAGVDFTCEAWTAEEIQRLRNMLQMGCSYSEIGGALNRTRNAVAGKVARVRRRDERKSSIPA